MKSYLLMLLACSPLACASTNSNSNPGGDGGVVDAAADAFNPCANGSADLGLTSAKPPSGKQLHSGNDLSVRGVTTDGYVIYSDDVALSLHAVPIDGGTPSDLGPLGAKFWVNVIGNVVFIWSNVSDANVGALATWSANTGVHAISSASLGLIAAASEGGDRVMYVDHVDAKGAVGDVFGASTDGTGTTKLVSGAVVQGCFPQLGFVGEFAVATHCDAPPNGAPSSTVSSFTKSWTKAELAKSAANYWAAASASQVLVSTAGGISVVPISGGAPKTIDSTGFLGVLTADGKSALYSSINHELKRSLVSSPAPTTLVTSGFGGFYAMSLDERWVLYFANIGSTGGDVFLASAVTPGAPTTLSATPTGAIRGDAFTASSSHALYSTEIDGCSNVGAFRAMPVGSSSPVNLGQRVWSDLAIAPSKLVFNDNFIASKSLRFGRADVEWVDLDKGVTPTRLVDRADAVIALSPKGDQLVYSWSAQPGALSGIYVVALP